MAPAELTLTAIATAAACAVPGTFLVLRRLTLVGDAIGHVVLLGIVIGFLLGGSLDSPWVIVGATAVGVFAVGIVEALERARLVKNDAALGLVYPALFSMGVILVSRFGREYHLDVDAVLLGNLVLAPFREMIVFGVNLGPWSLAALMSGMFLLNAAFVFVLYKELKITTFDPDHAASLGFRPGWVHYALMTLVSLTVVTAFDAAGAVLVVAFLVAPAATAYLFTDRLTAMLLGAVGIAALAAWAGTELAVWSSTSSIAGSIAAVCGAIFMTSLLLAPRHGLLAKGVRRWRVTRSFERGLLVVHLAHHEGTAVAGEENRADRLAHHLCWLPAKVTRVLTSAERHELVRRVGPIVELTGAGRARAGELLGRTFMAPV